MWRYYTEPKPLCITKPFFVVSEAYMIQPAVTHTARFERRATVHTGDEKGQASSGLPKLTLGQISGMGSRFCNWSFPSAYAAVSSSAAHPA